MLDVDVDNEEEELDDEDSRELGLWKKKSIFLLYRTGNITYFVITSMLCTLRKTSVKI